MDFEDGADFVASFAVLREPSCADFASLPALRDDAAGAEAAGQAAYNRCMEPHGLAGFTDPVIGERWCSVLRGPYKVRAVSGCGATQAPSPLTRYP